MTMNNANLSIEQIDALQEIVNIAMGQAGDSLARVLNSFVRLSVPRIRLINSAQASQCIAEIVGDTQQITAVRQSFYNKLCGEALTLFSSEGCRDLATLMGHQTLDTETEKELLFDISNILVGACLNGIAEQLGADLSFSAPSLMASNVVSSQLLSPDTLPWAYALQVEVNFSLEQHKFKSHLIIMLAEDAITALADSLNYFIEAI
ncbi:MAG: chemotaxis protein CheC [Pseudomonadota bacterium]